MKKVLEFFFSSPPLNVLFCYTVKDVVRLKNVLIIRYELDCTIRFHTPTQPRIHIKQRSMPKLRARVRPYFCESMMYKLGVIRGK